MVRLACHGINGRNPRSSHSQSVSPGSFRRHRATSKGPGPGCRAVRPTGESARTKPRRGSGNRPAAAVPMRRHRPAAEGAGLRGRAIRPARDCSRAESGRGSRNRSSTPGSFRRHSAATEWSCRAAGTIGAVDCRPRTERMGGPSASGGRGAIGRVYGEAVSTPAHQNRQSEKRQHGSHGRASA